MRSLPIYLSNGVDVENIEETKLTDVSDIEDVYGDHLLKDPTNLIKQLENLDPMEHIRVMRLVGVQMARHMYDPDDEQLLENFINLMIESCKFSFLPSYCGFISYVDQMERDTDEFKMFSRFHLKAYRSSRDYVDHFYHTVIQEAKNLTNNSVEYGQYKFSHTKPKENEYDE
jgi:hypothetical protein